MSSMTQSIIGNPIWDADDISKKKKKKTDVQCVNDNTTAQSLQFTVHIVSTTASRTLPLTMMHTSTAAAYGHHPGGYPSFLSYAPTLTRKSDYGMSLHPSHHYLNDSLGANTSSSSPSSNNSTAHLLSYSGYSTGLDLSSHGNSFKRPRSEIDEDEENKDDHQPLSSSSPVASVLGDITSTTNGQTMINGKQHLSQLKQDYSPNDMCPSLPFKKRARAVPPEQKDSAYFEKRARNNESAKRSRDARRIKEQQIQERVVYLEHENSRLVMENQALRYQLSQLHALCGVSKPLQ